MLSDTTSVENRVTRAHFTARGTALKNASYFPDDPAVSAISLTLDSFSTSHRSRLLYTRGSQNSELSAFRAPFRIPIRAVEFNFASVGESVSVIFYFYRRSRISTR